MRKFMATIMLAAGASSSALALAQGPGAAPLADTPADGGIVVTASRSGDPVSGDLVGSSVTVLDSEALELRQTRILSDILRDVPGVAVSRSGAIGGKTDIRIRGSEGNHVLVYVDGIKASNPYQGEFDFAHLIADENARVEVLRGQQSALYGSDAIGGVISYTTLSGREAPGWSLRAEGGSFGTFSTAGRAAGTVGDSFDYALSASYLTTDGYPTAPGGTRDIGSDNLGTSARFNWTPGPDFRVTAVARYNRTKADYNDQAITAASPVILGYPVVTAVDSPGFRYRNSSFSGLLGAELDLFDDALTTALSGQITDVDNDNYNAFGYSYGNRGRRYRANFVNTVRFGNDRVRNRFTAAIDYEREEFRTVDPYGYAFTGKRHIDNWGFVTQYDVTVDDRLALGASARIDANDRFGDTTTWRLTGSYILPTATRIHAAWGTGVKSPTATELFGYYDGVYIGNADLRPERSRGWEAGVEQKLAGDALVLGATYFRNRFFDQIETAYAFVNGSYVSTSRNTGKTSRQRGIEAYANARFGDWRVDAAYTWLKAPQTVLVLADPAPANGGWQDPVEVETQAIRRAKNIASFNLSYVPQDLPFSATLTVRHNGRQRDYAFNSNYQYLLADLKAYTLVNLAAAFDISRAVQIYGRVENLFDENYQEVFTFATPGRGAYGGVRVRF
ncbi:TonB-dependent receptor [Sphingobium jiangsuense]|uniref:Vitamin B12 transporter n=1 Tax=Sphingobium jiangsuense TaxID=870476 RepID=A0A7W6BMR9_9SPHN|nr:TonB-dependent receptor [Sphingobium jiangsuense]MBB3926467.1 vitamin B12 transporter [Sphingobium jiangsuense]GLT02173.1 TonB-dependent receptor [Sphingobium jiangsuense]